MSSVLNSTQSLVLATAMLVSSTVIFLAFSKPKDHSDKEPPQDQQAPRSCLYSEEKKRGAGKKKKRVQFAENVKETAGNGDEYRKQCCNKKFAKKESGKICSTDDDDHHHHRIVNGRMPANRVALYNGILRDRVHRMQCSY